MTSHQLLSSIYNFQPEGLTLWLYVFISCRYIRKKALELIDYGGRAHNQGLFAKPTYPREELRADINIRNNQGKEKPRNQLISGFLVREAGLEPARPEWTLEPERAGIVLIPVNTVHSVPKNIFILKIL